ncbi:MAG: hypothetical protein ACFE0J_00720 [Elainellaceae cyanobacterium]
MIPEFEASFRNGSDGLTIGAKRVSTDGIDSTPGLDGDGLPPTYS